MSDPAGAGGYGAVRRLRETMMALRFLDHLRERHAKLERAIDDERLRAWPDSTRLNTLKKSKLTVKDRMARLLRGGSRAADTGPVLS